MIVTGVQRRSFYKALTEDCGFETYCANRHRGAVEEYLGKVRSIDQSTSALSVSFSGDQGEHP